MAIQDNFWTIGNEAVAYGTRAATLTRGIENQTDDVTPNVEHRVSQGMRPGTVATPVGRSVAHQYGGSVSLMLDIMANSLGLVFAGFGSSVATTTPGGATLARLHTIYPTTAGPTRSSTVHAGRYDMSGTVHHTDYLGCMGTELAVSQAAKGNATVKASYNYKTLDTAASSVTPSYPTNPTIFTDLDCTITLDGAELTSSKQSDLTIQSGLAVDLDRIGGRRKPVLMDRVACTGSLMTDYDDDDIFGKYLSGEDVPLVFSWMGALIEGSTYESLTITLPAIQYTGSSPKVGVGVTPEQSAPFQVLDDLTNAPWKIEIVNADTAV